MVLFPLLNVNHPLGFALETALEDFGFAPVRGPDVEMQLLGPQWVWLHQGLRGVGGEGSRKYSALEGYVNQYWPIHTSIFACRSPFPEREAWKATVYNVASSWTLRAAVRRYPSSKVRSSGCALLEQP